MTSYGRVLMRDVKGCQHHTLLMNKRKHRWHVVESSEKKPGIVSVRLCTKLVMCLVAMASTFSTKHLQLLSSF